MRHSHLFVLALLCITMASLAHAQQSEDKVLHREKISDGRELVVLQHPLIPATVMKDLLPADVVGRVPGWFSMSVEIRSPNQPPLRVWSQLNALTRQEEYDEIQVLDFVVVSEHILMVWVGHGSTIYLVDIGLRGPSQWTSLRLADWSQIPVALNRPGRLAAKLKYHEKTERTEVQITDFLEDTKQHTRFEQMGGWEFEPVKRWHEKVAATQPALEQGEQKRGHHGSVENP